MSGTQEQEKQLEVAGAMEDVRPPSAFHDIQNFENAQRMAQALASSTLVPQEYRGNQNLGNVLIALELSQRTNSSPMMVMQNVNIIQGRPSWSSQFIIAALNSCGRFSPLRFSVEGEGDDKTCRAWAYDKASGEVLEGPPVSIRMAKDEGWYGRNGSKWKTMPDTMLRYRAAAFFGRLYAPDILMGMQTADELQDIGPSANAPSAPEPQSGPAPTLAGVQDTEPEEAEVVESEPDPEPDPAQPTLDPHQALGADYIACLICGKQYKTLTRHLSQTHGETPESYRARFGLEDNYPMQAPNLGQGSSQEQGGQQESAAPAGQQEPGLGEQLRQRREKAEQEQAAPEPEANGPTPCEEEPPEERGEAPAGPAGGGDAAGDDGDFF